MQSVHFFWARARARARARALGTVSCVYLCVCVCVCSSLSWRILDIEVFHSHSVRMMCKLHTQKAVSAV